MFSYKKMTDKLWGSYSKHQEGMVKEMPLGVCEAVDGGRQSYCLLWGCLLYSLVHILTGTPFQ